MDDKEVSISEMFGEFDISKIIGASFKEEQIDTLVYLLDSFGISIDTVKNKDVFLRNFIYSMVTIRKHLLEIEDSLAQIIQAKKGLEKDSYEFRKVSYFEQKNKDAKEQIIQFITNNLKDYLFAQNNSSFDLINRENNKIPWLHGPNYDYHFNSKYYDPYYDFSSSAKFIYIPGKSLLNSFAGIDNVIRQKVDSPEEYKKLVVSTVEDNKVLSSMVERVKNNYHLHHRVEIFESMLNLFQEGKYLTFIINATLQIEGIFFDWLSIKFGEKEKQGTLVEKVGKSFNDNEALKNMLYPYFAFDIPELRNQVAHKGIVESIDLKQQSYELILDLNCVLSLAEKESIDKHKTFLMLRDKLNEVDKDTCASNEDSKKKIAETLFSELFTHYPIADKHFWELLKHPDNFEEELSFYEIENAPESAVSLKEIVESISKWCKTAEFWSVIDEICSFESAADNYSFGFGTFVRFLVKNFIPILDGEAKTICCKINSILS